MKQGKQTADGLTEILDENGKVLFETETPKLFLNNDERTNDMAELMKILNDMFKDESE